MFDDWLWSKSGAKVVVYFVISKFFYNFFGHLSKERINKGRYFSICCGYLVVMVILIIISSLLYSMPFLLYPCKL